MESTQLELGLCMAARSRPTIDRSSQLAPAPSTEPPAPTGFYLQSLGPGSRRTMRSSLDIVARQLSAGSAGAADFLWQELTCAQLVQVRNWLRSGPYRPSTANRHLDAVRGVLRAAWRLGLLSTDQYLRLMDIRRLRQLPEPAGRLVSAAEVARLLAPARGDHPVAAARDTAMLAVLFHCAARPSEICALDLGWFDLDQGFLRFPKSKNKDRWLPLSPELVSHLEPWLRLRGATDGPLFCRLTQRDHVTLARLTCEGVRYIIRRRAGRAGVARFTPSDARRAQ